MNWPAVLDYAKSVAPIAAPYFAAVVAAIVGVASTRRARLSYRLANQADERAEQAEVRAQAAEVRALRAELRAEQQEARSVERGDVVWEVVAGAFGVMGVEPPRRRIDLVNHGADTAYEVTVIVISSSERRVTASADEVAHGETFSVDVAALDPQSATPVPKHLRRYENYLPETEYHVLIRWRTAAGSWSKIDRAVGFRAIGWTGVESFGA